MNRSLEFSSIKPNIPIILASGSDSRKQMLEEAGIIFEVIASSADEDLIKNKIASLPFASAPLFCVECMMLLHVVCAYFAHPACTAFYK